MKRNDFIDTEKRTPVENLRTFLVTLCVGFTILMVLSLAFAMVFAGGESMRGVRYCWSLLGACAVAAALQFVFFTPTVIRRMGYPLRLAAFGACLYGVLAALAVTMGWFPAGSTGAWTSFTLAYLIMLAAATACFSLRQRHDRRELDERLAKYREKNG